MLFKASGGAFFFVIEIQFLVLKLVHPVVVSGCKIGCREVIGCAF